MTFLKVVSSVLSVLALAVLASTSPVAAAQPPTAAGESALKLARETLADGIYLFRAPTAVDRWTATNVVVIVNERDVTVFDSFTRPATARMVIAEIRTITDKPVRTLINSHWHMDHWSGNDEFARAFPGIQIIATAETRGYMSRMGSAFLIDSTRAGLTRSRETLAAAIASGKLADGSALTPETRRQMEQEIADTARFVEEMNAVPRVLPDVAFRDELTLWRGGREFRLLSMTGDATGSAVLYLPAEKILVTGDVLVSPPDGNGPPTWTTNSYAIAPWLTSLRRMEALDIGVIVPGQGPAMRDKTYLRLTAELYATIISQVHAALERGVFKLEDVLAAVDVDAIGRRYPSGQTGVNTPFGRLVAALARKVLQESLDGVVRER